MRHFSNLCWPDDPYGTGQLYRRSVPLLAAFSPLWCDDGTRALPIAYAAVYVRLHRTRTLPIDPEQAAFGFRAVVVEDDHDVPELVRLFDLDVLQARRHADLVAGYSFVDDLYGMAKAATFVPRGVNALQEAWPGRDRLERGKARLVDVGGDESPTAYALRDACLRYDIAPGTAPRGLALPSQVAKRWAELGDEAAYRWLAAAATERALLIALAAGRAEERVTWPGKMNIGAALAASTREYDSMETPV